MKKRKRSRSRSRSRSPRAKSPKQTTKSGAEEGIKRDKEEKKVALSAETKKEETKTKDKKARQIGVIFHWGIYSVPAFDVINPSRHILNGSEWYQKRLLEKGNYRPVSGYKETQEYHRKNYGTQSYANFANGFTAQNWNIQEWMNLAKSIGATYAILTAKHHDGFCLWNTKTTTNNSVALGPHLDLLREFADACRKNGLAFGIYYSWMEFLNSSCTKNYINTIIVPQVNELMNYKPDIWWFDGHWPCNSIYAKEVAEGLIRKIRLKNKDVEINDRIPGNKEEIKNPNNLGISTFRNYADRELPKIAPKVPWESIQTIGYSWGRNRQQQKEHYKSGAKLLELIQKVFAKNGNFLINLGPNPDGTLDPFEVAALQELATLLKK